MHTFFRVGQIPVTVCTVIVEYFLTAPRPCLRRVPIKVASKVWCFVSEVCGMITGSTE